MKPGEFVGADGQRWWLDGVALHRQDGSGAACFYPADPDFPAAAAALQSLLPKPTVHPAVGLRFCGEEKFKFGAGGLVYEVLADGVLVTGNDLAGTEMQRVFDHGREYERRQG